MRRSRRCAAILAARSRLCCRARPRGWTAISVMRRSATGVTLPASSASSRPRLRSAGRAGPDSAARSSGCAATTRPNRNSSSSRSSSRPSASATMTRASTARCSTASARSDGLAHRDETAAVMSSSVAGATRPPNRAEATSSFCRACLAGSASARRSACSRSSTRRTANSSSPSISATTGPGTSSASRSLSAANDDLLTPCIRTPPRLGIPASGARSQCPLRRSCHRRERRLTPSPPAARTGPEGPCPLAGCRRRSPGRPRARAVAPLQLAEEPVHHPALPRLVLEGLAHDAAGQLGGERPHLGAERGQRVLAVRLDLRVGGLRDATGLGLGLLAHLGDDLRALLPRLLAEAGGLVPRVGELLLVLLEHARRLGLGPFGALKAALDPVGPLLQGPGDPRHQHLAEDAEDREERDRPDDQFLPGREYRAQ